MTRALGIDHGEARIGLAISDELGMLAHALETSSWSHAKREVTAFAELLQPIRRSRPTRTEALAWLTALNKIVQREPSS